MHGRDGIELPERLLAATLGTSLAVSSLDGVGDVQLRLYSEWGVKQFAYSCHQRSFVRALANRPHPPLLHDIRSSAAY